ncbi:MAG: potassium channel protein [Bacteroidales bacterium]|nr:potassium channel protein [Bacteroidales bacterium]
MFKEFRNIYIASVSLLTVFIGGTIGFMYIENYSLIEAVYTTIMAISTVGFEVVKPLSQNGMIFIVILIITGLGFFGYFLTSVTRIFIDGDYKKLVNIYLRNKKIENLKNHIIICGFGRNGRQATIDLLRINEKVVIIDNNADIIHETINEEIVKNKNFTFIRGDASHEESLLKANLKNAKALITTLPNDAENLLIILTARDINTRMTIISRASDEHSYSKLKRAGANNVIMPDIVGGSRMAKLVVEPDIIEFLEMIMLREGVDVNLEEISCDDLASCFVDSTISDLDIRKKTGSNIIGLKLENGEYMFNPNGSIKLKKEDKLFVLGTVGQIQKLKDLLESGHYFDDTI